MLKPYAQKKSTQTQKTKKCKNVKESIREYQSLQRDNFSVLTSNVERIFSNIFSLDYYNRLLKKPIDFFDLDNIKYKPGINISNGVHVQNVCLKQQLFNISVKALNKISYTKNKHSGCIKYDSISINDCLFYRKSNTHHQTSESVHSSKYSMKRVGLNLEVQKSLPFNISFLKKYFLSALNFLLKEDILNRTNEPLMVHKSIDNLINNSYLHTVVKNPKNECSEAIMCETAGILCREDESKAFCTTFLNTTEQHKSFLFTALIEYIINIYEKLRFVNKDMTSFGMQNIHNENMAMDGSFVKLQRLYNVLSYIFLRFLYNSIHMKYNIVNKSEKPMKTFNLGSNWIKYGNLYEAFKELPLPVLRTFSRSGTLNVELIAKEIEKMYFNSWGYKKYETANYEKCCIQMKRKKFAVNDEESIFYGKANKRIKIYIMDSSKNFRSTCFSQENSYGFQVQENSFRVFPNDGKKQSFIISPIDFDNSKNRDGAIHVKDVKNGRKNNYNISEVKFESMKNNGTQVYSQYGMICNFLSKSYLGSMEINKSLDYRVQSYFPKNNLNSKRKCSFLMEDKNDNFNRDFCKRKPTSCLESKKIKQETIRNKHLGNSCSSDRNLKIIAVEEIRSFVTMECRGFFDSMMTKLMPNREPKDAVDDIKFCTNKIQTEKSDNEFSAEIIPHCSRKIENNSDVKKSENVTDLISPTHKILLDSFYKKTKFDLLWKNRCVIETAVSVKSIIGDSPLCNEKDTSGKNKEKRCTVSKNSFEINQNNENLSDENETYEEISIMNSNKNTIRSANANNKKLIPDAEISKSELTSFTENSKDFPSHGKRDISCQTEISSNLVISTSPSYHKDTVSQNFRIYDFQNTETDLVKMDIMKTGQKRLFKNSIDHKDCKITAADWKYSADDGNSGEEFDSCIRTRENEHVVPYNEEYIGSRRSVVRLGLSRKRKAEPLHPYLRRQRDWFF